MPGEHILSFGVYKGKSLRDLSQTFPSYLLWIAGVKTKYSMTTKAQELYSEICKNYPEDAREAQEFVKGRCYQCWELSSTGEKHFCNKMKARAHYEYHPYGKRT